MDYFLSLAWMITGSLNTDLEYLNNELIFAALLYYQVSCFTLFFVQFIKQYNDTLLFVKIILIRFERTRGLCHCCNRYLINGIETSMFYQFMLQSYFKRKLPLTFSGSGFSNVELNIFEFLTVSQNRTFEDVTLDSKSNVGLRTAMLVCWPKGSEQKISIGRIAMKPLFQGTSYIYWKYSCLSTLQW